MPGSSYHAASAPAPHAAHVAALPLFIAPRGARPPLRRRLGWLATVIAAHAAAVYVLLRVDGVREAFTAAAPIMVEFIAPPPQPEVVRPRGQPRPLPVAREPETPRPRDVPTLLSTAASGPAPAWTAPPPQPAPNSMAVPPSVTAPVFNADYLRNPPPPYPPQSRRRGEQGKVELRVYVSAEGLAETVEVQSSSGSTRLDDAALEAVRAWRFVPARQGNTAVAAWVVVPILFKLGD